MEEIGKRFRAMLERDQVHNRDLMLKNFLNKTGIDKVSSELRKLKNGISGSPEFSVNLKVDKHEEDKHCDSDSESEIKIWIDFWQTPHPKLRDPLPFFDDENDVKDCSNDDEMKSEVEHDEVRQDSSHKSGPDSEKSISKKKLCSNKEASDMSNTTQCSSGKQSANLTSLVVKSKASKPAPFVKDEKRAEPEDANVHDDKIGGQPDGKELEFKDSKQDKPPALLNENNHSFVLENFKFGENLLASVESHEFMASPHKVLEKPKESKGHFESEDRHHYDFEMEHNEYIGEFGHIHQKQMNSSIDNRFEFDEAHENDHGIHDGLFLNDEFMNHPRQFD